jgi:uncharacterized protein YifN (PemK superfamily)
LPVEPAGPDIYAWVMAIMIHPRPGQILICDFSLGFKEPGMVKKRPVVALTPSMQGRGQLVTVVALSSMKPNPVQKFHCLLPKASLPMSGKFQSNETWVKGDMVYAVVFHRLDLIKVGVTRP